MKMKSKEKLMGSSTSCNCGQCPHCCRGCHGGTTWGMAMKIILALSLLAFGLNYLSLQNVAIVYGLVLLIKAAKMAMNRM